MSKLKGTDKAFKKQPCQGDHFCVVCASNVAEIPVPGSTPRPDLAGPKKLFNVDEVAGESADGQHDSQPRGAADVLLERHQSAPPALGSQATGAVAAALGEDGSQGPGTPATGDADPFVAMLGAAVDSSEPCADLLSMLVQGPVSKDVARESAVQFGEMIYAPALQKTCARQPQNL